MKKLLIISLSALVAACGGAGEESELSKLIAKRDSLKDVHAQIGKELADLNSQILVLDTTKKFTMVSIVGANPSTFQHYFEVYGNVESDQSIEIIPEIPGRVTEILVSEGQKVSKGQVLIKLNTELDNAQQQAKVGYDQAKDIFTKQQALWEQKIGSELEYLSAKRNFESAEQVLKQVTTQLEKTIIRATFDGIVDEIFPRVGEMPQGPVVRLVNLNNMYVKADVSEAYVGKINKGTEVEVKFNSINRQLSSKINQVGNYINPNNRTFSIQVELENKDGLIKPNLLAILKIKDFEADSAIVISSTLIQQTPSGENFIYILDDNNRVTKLEVKTGLSYQGKTMIISGLKGDEKIIDKGSRSVKEGQQVAIAK